MDYGPNSNKFAISDSQGRICVIAGMYTPEEAQRLIVELTYLTIGYMRKVYPTAEVYLHSGWYKPSDLMSIFDRQAAALKSASQPTTGA